MRPDTTRRLRRARLARAGLAFASHRAWWVRPLGVATVLGRIDLGGRVLDVIPIPGHEPSGIALYDRRTGVLLTGDTFYPDRLYVRDTAAFARSIARLAAFARRHPVAHLLGAHVENTRTPYRDYPVGTVDQPAEHALALGSAELFALDAAVRAMRGRIVRTALPDLTVWPVAP